MIRAVLLRRTSHSGQTTVEYALVIAVLAIALVAAAWALVPLFVPAMQRLGDRAGTVYTTGDLAR